MQQFFANNLLTSEDTLSYGGALNIYHGNLSLHNKASFHNNKAKSIKSYGGAITLLASNALFSVCEFDFQNNSAVTGGGVHSEISQLTVIATKLHFTGNFAKLDGGSLAIQGFRDMKNIITTANFTDNLANECGGALYIDKGQVIFSEDVQSAKNSRSALCILDSNVIFQGYAKIAHNFGRLGGGIRSINSRVLFTNSTEFNNNKAIIGGGIYSIYGKLFISEYSSFTYNVAERYGGAVYALGTDVTVQGTANFKYNTAQSGGGLYFKSSATLALQLNTTLNMSSNYALENGGAIYHEDNNTSPVQL